MEVNALENEIPLLISKKSVKNMVMILDVQKDNSKHWKIWYPIVLDKLNTVSHWLVDALMWKVDSSKTLTYEAT